MTTLIQWSGDGLSGNLTTSSADANDTAPSFITGATPTIEPAGPRSPAIRFAQVDTTANYASWIFSADDLSSYAIRIYVLFGAGFVASGQGSLARVVNAAESLLSWGVEVTSGGLLRIIDKNGGTAATGTVALSSGVWYRVEAVVNGSSYSVYAYQEEQTTVVDTVTATLASPVSGGRVRLGNAAGSPIAPAFYVDDLLVTNTAEQVGPAVDTVLYATLAELKAYVGITDTADDDLLTDALTSASRGIDHFCGRRFVKSSAASARVYYPDTRLRVDVDDFHTTTDLVVKTDDGDDGTYETTWSSTEYQLEPLNGIRDGETGWPYNRIVSVEGRWFPHCSYRAPIQITAQWGWATVPAAVKQACLIVAAETHKLKDAPFGVASYGDFGVVRVRNNPMAAGMLAPYRRHTVLVG